MVAQAQQELAQAQQAAEEQQAQQAREAQHRLAQAKLRLQHCVQWGTRLLDRNTCLHTCHNAFRWWRYALWALGTAVPHGRVGVLSGAGYRMSLPQCLPPAAASKRVRGPRTLACCRAGLSTAVLQEQEAMPMASLLDAAATAGVVCMPFCIAPVMARPGLD